MAAATKKKSQARARSRSGVNAKNREKAGRSAPRFHTAVSPATLEELGRVPFTDLSKLPAMFVKAREAQRQWAATPFSVRRRHIRKMQDYIVTHAVELARVVSQENGKSRTDALATEVIPCALSCDWYGKNAPKVLKPKRLPSGSILFFNKRNVVVRAPLGVVGVISPWNYPLSIPFGEVVMGLMAGNAIMLKVAAATVLVGKAIEEIVAAGELPDGLFHHIVGSGGEVSRAFFENKVDKIFFTGSVPTGKILMAQAAANLTPLSLELGGNDPMVVFADADLERAANGAAWAGYQNAGQSCGGVERIYVHESIYDPFVQLLAEKTASMRHGVDINFDVDMGSMTTEDQLLTVRRHVTGAVKGGAKIVAQSSPAFRANGYFHPATLMTGVNHQMDLMREETFGPVLPVMKFRDVDEAVLLANDSTMALTASIWTKNIHFAQKLAHRITAGAVTINDHLYTHGMAETPWGGPKESGLGRTHGVLGLEEMTQPRLINWDILPWTKRNLWWYPFSREQYDALLSALYFAFPRNPLDWVKNAVKFGRFAVRKIFTPWNARAR